jgi:hypothetical protein
MHLAEVSAAQDAEYYLHAVDPLRRLVMCLITIVNESGTLTLKHLHLTRQLIISAMTLQPRVTLRMKLSMMRRGLKSL